MLEYSYFVFMHVQNECDISEIGHLVETLPRPIGMSSTSDVYSYGI